MDVEVSKQVRLVVGTHAHDDHIAGLGRVLEACTEATFVCSSALTREEFFADIDADEEIEQFIRKSIRSEYRRIFELVKARTGAGGIRPLKRAIEQRVLLTRNGSASAPKATITALSPSDHAVTRATQVLAAGLGRAGEELRLATTDPNELAVALSVNVGDTAVLLGADLLRGPMGCGWTAVLATHTPQTLASVFKVPHHGAPNAHHSDVWSQLVVREVISLVAPYRAGRAPRTSPADISRIKESSKAVYCTAKPQQPAPSRALKRTRAALTGLAENVREWGTAGQVRARRVCGARDWDVATFAPALQL